MITINLSPEQHKLLLDGLTIANRVQEILKSEQERWSWIEEDIDSTDFGKFKRLLDEIDFTQDSLDQENVLSYKGETGERVQS